MGKGIRDAPRDALLAESAPPEVRGKAFGFHRSMDTTGAIAGPLLALGLLATIAAGMPALEAYRLVILLAVLPALISVALVFRVRETLRARTPKRPLLVSFRGAPRSLLTFVAIASAFSLAELSYVFLLLRAGAEQGTVAAIGLYVFFNVVYAASAFPAGALSDRVGRRPVILAGYGSFAGMALLLANAPVGASLALFVPAFALYGLSYGLAHGTQRALVADLAPKERKATILGAYHTSVGLVKIASGVVAGSLWTALLPEGSGTFWFAFVVATLATIGLAVWRPPVTS
jgi:MFS family permease